MLKDDPPGGGASGFTGCLTGNSGIFLIPVILFFLWLPAPSAGQYRLGISQSNYAGTCALHLNPALMVTSRYYMDFHLFTFGSFVENDYLFIHRRDYNPFRFITGGPYPSYGESGFVTDVNRSLDDKEGIVGVYLEGPSAMLVYGKHAFGISTAFRSISSFRNLPVDMAVFLYEALDYYPQHDLRFIHLKDARAGSLMWSEIGLSYAWNFHRNKWEYWSAGISVKPLLGMSAIYVNIHNVDYYVDNDTVAYVYDVSFDYGYSLPVDYDNNDYPEGPLSRGFGISADAGVIYQKTERGHSTVVMGRLCEQRFEHYRYRAGLSILDLGYIRFRKKADVREFIHRNTVWLDWEDTVPEGSVNEITAKLDHYFSDFPGQSARGDQFTMHLPPVVSLQFDWAVRRELYLNGMVFFGFSIGHTYVKRPTVFAFTPRYEIPKLEFSVPVSMFEFDWKHPRIGLFFRHHNFFIGTDKIGEIFGLSDITGFDLYFGIKLNLSKNIRMSYLKGDCSPRKYFNIETFDYRNF